MLPYMRISKRAIKEIVTGEGRKAIHDKVLPALLDTLMNYATQFTEQLTYSDLREYNANRVIALYAIKEGLISEAIAQLQSELESKE
jgi:hypothetical protein